MSIMQMLFAKIAEIVRAWDLEYAQFNGKNTHFYHVASHDKFPYGVFFKPDGKKFYISGSQNDKIYEFDLSIEWNVTTATFKQSKSVATLTSFPGDLFFKSDGTRMYVTRSNDGKILQFNLSTAWDISTAVYTTGDLKDIASEETSPRDVFLKPDGSKMYVIGTNSDTVREYNLSTAWDITTASYSQGFSVSTQDSVPTSLFFKPDGTKMFVLGDAGNDLNEYTLSTAWDISTASYSQNFSVQSLFSTPSSLSFRADGHGFFLTDRFSGHVVEYKVSTAWDISTASYIEPTTDFLDVSAEEGSPQASYFKPDGTKVYVVGTSGDKVNQYNLSTAWDINTATYSQNFSVATEETSPLGLFFKSDGTKMFVLGIDGDDVNEYDLSTAWDISTASYSQNFYIGTQAPLAQCLSFKYDGTKMYVLCYSTDKVHEYDLSTAWDVSTASYNQASPSIVSQEPSARGLYLSEDGLRMYICGTTQYGIFQYDLSTAWDISTISFKTKGQYSIYNTYGTSFTGLFFQPDGSKLFMTTQNPDRIWAFNIPSNPVLWTDVSNAALIRSDTINFTNRGPNGVFFKPDGTKIYISSSSTTSDYNITEQTLSTPWDISSHGSVTHTFNPPTATGGNYSRAQSQSIFFKPDGLMLFYADFDTDQVVAHTLSTAWDLSSINTSSSAELAISSEQNLKGIYFSPDGTKLFVHGFNTDLIRRYTLSTAWDITTATAHSTSGSCSSTPLGLWFTYDGTRMYVADNTDDNVKQWDLTTPWDISGVNSTNYDDDLDMSLIDTIPVTLFIDDSGSRLYVTGSQNDALYQFNL